MTITVNEKHHELDDGTTLFALRDALKPGADVLVVNGAPARTDQPLMEGDAVVLIQRGEQPNADELEALMVSRHTPGVHDKIKSATVGIAGLGGLGSAIAVALARIGVGHLILIDFDVVEPSNLNRQQYFIDQIGLYKTDALSQNLARINPYVKITSTIARLDESNVAALFADAAILVEAFDTADGKAMLAESWSIAYPDRPIVMATGLAGHEPSNTIVTRRLGDTMVVVGDLVTAARPGVGLMAPRVGVAAHHQANAVLRLLLGEAPEGNR